MSTASGKQQTTVSDDDELLRSVEVLLAGLRFGSVEITVHEGRIVQIERREKIRLPTQTPRK